MCGFFVFDYYLNIITIWKLLLIYITYNTNINDSSYVLTLLYKNKLYFQKLVLLTIATILTALILFTRL